MLTKRSVTLALSFLVLSLPVFAQQVIATVPVGLYPAGTAVGPMGNFIYVVNNCGSDPNCASKGTVTVINGDTNTVRTTVTVGYYPNSIVVNTATNYVYVVNNCGDDPNCASAGTVSVINGGNFTVTGEVTVGSNPLGIAANPTTNKIYVVNVCGADLTCQTVSGTVTAIDGATLNTVSVAVGANPYNPVVNPVTNKIYVPNACGTDPTCATFNGTLSVIDGPTNNVTSVNVGISPTAADVDTSSNMIYVANECGDDPTCASTATMTAVNGTSLATTDVPIGGFYPFAIGVNSVTHSIFVPDSCYSDASCNNAPYGTVSVFIGGTLTGYTSVPAGYSDQTMAIDSAANKAYVVNSCGVDPNCATTGTVTVIDGVTLATANVGVGNDPYGPAINSTTHVLYVPNYLDATTSVINGAPPSALQFVPLAQPCRAVDTRPQYGGNGPIQGGTSQNFSISGSPACGTLPSAAAYSMNVTVVPQGTLGYLTIWPTGQPQPLASTLNSVDGRVKADAAITQAGTSGQVSVYVTNTTDVIIDVNGYFTPPAPSTLAFYPLPPCRVADTRTGTYPGLGPPSLTHGMERDFPILNATGCNIPSTAAAYSLNFTVVPPGPLGYLTVWPTGQSKPTVSTLNDVGGLVIANAAIVVAGTNSEVAVYPSDNTDLVIDINGYFAAAGPGGLSFYGLTPCRVLDTRKVGTGQPFGGTLTPPVDVLNAGCSALSTSQGYVFNATVVPMGSLGYLTLWPDGEMQPVVSTLNATDGSITNNMAIVPTNPMTTTGIIDAYAGNGITQLILDLSGYFAP